MSIIRIVAAVVDTKQITLYKQDGTTVDIPQGDQRVRAIVDEVLPIVQNGGVAEIDLDTIGGIENNLNPYRQFEELSQNLIQFFRIGKKVLEGILAAAEKAEKDENGNMVGPIPPMTVGSIPVAPEASDEDDDEVETQEEKLPPPISAAVDEIIAHAEPVSGEGYSEGATTDEHTIVGVVDNAGTKTPIPGMENLKEQFTNSVRSSTKGMENFLKRIGAVIDKRQHSVEDVLRFLQKGDLPIADDGSILVYKVLRRKDDHYVDCHTSKVPQRIGSFVCVDPSLVDLSRRNECSNGLHVARRGYIGGFHGDLCTLAKVAPEDVMVVPHGDPNKVRVSGYHLLFELDNASWAALKANKPMTQNPGAAKLLGKAMAGDHPPRMEEVRIHGQSGTNVKITPLGDKKGQQVKTAPAKALDDQPEVEPVKPHEVADRVVQAAGSSRRQQAEELALKAINNKDPQAAADLLEMKRKAKVSWDTLGITSEVVTKITQLAASAKAEPEDNLNDELLLTEVVQPAPIAPPADQLDVARAIVDKETPAKPKAPETPAKLTQAQEVQMLVDSLDDPVASTEGRVAAARRLLDIRRSARKSWAKFGQPQLNDEFLRTLVNSHIDVAPPKDSQKKTATPPAAEKAIQATKEMGKAAKAKKATKPAAPAPTTGSRQERARALYEAKDWTGLAQFKKKAKVRWDQLGFTTGELGTIKLHLGD